MIGLVVSLVLTLTSPTPKLHYPLPYEDLPPAKKQIVKNDFNRAKSLYMQGRYADALKALEKHEHLTKNFSEPAMGSSEELKTFILEALDIQRLQAQQEAREKQRQLDHEREMKALEAVREPATARNSR